MHVPNRVAFDREGLKLTFDGSRIEIAVFPTVDDDNPVIGEFEPGLLQSEALVLGAFLEGRRGDSS